ncbi:MAG TPA: hypothetical protein VJM10_06840 [Candidatus Methylomirabilis sp.]|nr:hypothetical protein [Candidatus Methylomirabilis sp.]
MIKGVVTIFGAILLVVVIVGGGLFALWAIRTGNRLWSAYKRDKESR